MTNEQIIEALKAWVAVVIPDVAGKVYIAPPASKDLGLPDCVLALLAEEPVLDGEQFPYLAGIQQVEGYTLRFGLSFMVQVPSNDVGGEATADRAVRAYAEALKMALRSDDAALGDRELLGRAPAFDYDPPFVQYQDGTRGREMTCALAVAQLL